MRPRRNRRIEAAKIGVICAFLLIFAPAQASVLTQSVTFPAPEVVYQGGFCTVTITGIPSLGNPGEPLLPVYALEILLPQGEEVTSVTADILEIEEMRIEAPVVCAQRQVRMSRAASAQATVPDETIYGGDCPFPETRAVHVTTQTYRGYNIAFLRVYPVAYHPGRGSLLSATRMEVVIETASSRRLLMRSMGTLRSAAAKDAAIASRMVDHDDAAASYAAGAAFPVLSGFVNPEETYPYVIVTDYLVRPLIKPLKDYKDSTGLKAKIVILGEILYHYSGVDRPEQIRNFIKDAYANWETEYVLIAADDESIPHRGLFAKASGDSDLDIASDLYYAALDGNWNDDGDAYWGEPGEEDLIPEVSVGRISVRDSAEVVNFVNKIMKYERSPVVGQIKTALMAGEIIGAGTYGADYMNEIRDGASAHGFTTAGLDDGFAADTLYDRDYYPGEWDECDLVPLLNSGRHIVDHIGHCNLYSALKIDTAGVDTLFTNDGDSATYFILYTQGCYAASFDNRNPEGIQLFRDCIAEQFTNAENGPVAFIGNTRFGYYATGSTRGASQYFNRQFFDAVFGEGITSIGRAHDDSRVDNIAYIEFDAMRWVYYTLVLLGDPSMDIWTDEPGSLMVGRPDSVYAYENEMTIDVSDGVGPVSGARVSLLSANTISLGFTDGGGTCALDPMVESPGDLYISVTAHNFYSYMDTIKVVTAAGPLITLEDYTIDDDATGVSSGNSNAEVDAGETIESKVRLRNAGQDTAYNVTALISTASPFVTLIDSTGAFGDIPPDSAVTPSWSFAFSFLASCPDSQIVTFDLSIDYGDTSVVRHLKMPVHAPVLSIAGISVADTLYGDGNGCLEAGETFELVLGFKNVGSGDGTGVAIEIDESDPYVTLDVDSAYVDTIPVDSTSTLAPAYLITLTPDCPEFHEIDLGIKISFDSGRLLLDSTTLYLGGRLRDDFESGNRGWSHTNLWPTYADDWHLEDYRNHTPGGAYSWKFGGAGAANYSDFSYGALVTPELCVSGDAILTFCHYIETDMASQIYTWDGGIVQISTDGGESWAQIAPSGGYPHKIYGDSFCPLPAKTPCFGTNGAWQQVEFDLSAYEGRARIRFVFASGSVAAEEGWYVDDITIVDKLASVEVEPDGTKPDRFSLHPPAPNPVTSRALVGFDVPKTSRVRITVYDIEGRAADTIANATFEPGRYCLDWNAGTRLAPGVYFVKMDAPTFQQTRKVVIIR